MQVYKDGIERTIRDSEWQRYREWGFIQINVVEDKPEQDEIIEVDEYTVSKPKAKAKKK